MRADETLGIGAAAEQLGVTVDTLRRWDRAGKLETTRDERNRRRVPVAEVERLRRSPARHRAGDSFSARNRFPGTIRSGSCQAAISTPDSGPGVSRTWDAINIAATTPS